MRQVCACSDLDDTYVLESLKSDLKYCNLTIWLLVFVLGSHLIYKLALDAHYGGVMVFTFFLSAVKSGAGFVLAISLGSRLLKEKTEFTHEREHNKNL